MNLDLNDWSQNAAVDTEIIKKMWELECEPN